MYSVNVKPKIIILLEENAERKPLWFWVRQRYLDKTSKQDPEKNKLLLKLKTSTIQKSLLR